MAQAKAIEEGQEKLARLQETGESGDDNSSWGDVKQISYMQSQGLDHETLGVIFKVETSNLPAYTGSINPEGGFNLIRINKVIEPESIEKTKLDNFGKQLQQMITQEEMSSYLTMLRKRYEVRVKQDNF